MQNVWLWVSDYTILIIQVIKIFFVQFFLCILAISSWCLLLLLGLCCFYPLLCPSLHEIFLWYLQFSWRDLIFPFLLFSSIYLHCSLKKAFLSVCYSLELHSVGYIFPFLPWFLLLFFPQLFVKPPQKTTLPSCISFSLWWFCSLPRVQYNKPLFLVLKHSVY